MKGEIGYCITIILAIILALITKCVIHVVENAIRPQVFVTPPIEARNVCEMAPGDYAAHVQQRPPYGSYRQESAYDLSER